jgi:hypothetical protein
MKKLEIENFVALSFKCSLNIASQYLQHLRFHSVLGIESQNCEHKDAVYFHPRRILTVDLKRGTLHQTSIRIKRNYLWEFVN